MRALRAIWDFPENYPGWTALLMIACGVVELTTEGNPYWIAFMWFIAGAHVGEFVNRHSPATAGHRNQTMNPDP